MSLKHLQIQPLRTMAQHASSAKPDEPTVFCVCLYIATVKTFFANECQTSTFSVKICRKPALPCMQVIRPITNWSKIWWPRCESAWDADALSLPDLSHPPDMVELKAAVLWWLTTLCVRHQSPGGFWVLEPQVDWGLLSDQWVPQLLVWFASWHWRWSWRCWCQ